MAINQNWKLGRRSSKCFHSDQPFADGESIVTVILPVDNSDEFERRDYAAEFWEEVRADLEPFSFWRSQFEVPEPEAKKEEVVEKETAESLLRRLIEEDDPKTENARYILAVMLERKRTLKEVERKDTENGSRLLIYEQPKTGDVLIVRDPMLRLDEIEPIQDEVSALLAAKPAPTAGDAEEGADGSNEQGGQEGDGEAPNAGDASGEVDEAGEVTEGESDTGSEEKKESGADEAAGEPVVAGEGDDPVPGG